MALLSANRRERVAPSPASIGSRLLPDILDAERLERLGTVNILDFGRVNSASLEYFNQFPCRLSVLDAAEGLLEWSAEVAERASAEEPPSQQQLQRELAGLLRAMDARYDLVFLWDTLNHLHELALPAFSKLLRRHLSPRARGHGFMLHKRDAQQQLRRMGLAGVGAVHLLEQSEARLFPHTRKTVNEALGRELHIDHAVLHNDGRLEYVLAVAGSERNSDQSAQ